MTVFPQVCIPNPLDYVEYLIHQKRFSDAEMHLMDVSSKAQESDDVNMLAWNQFYKAVLSFSECPKESCILFDSAMSIRRSQDIDEAKMIFHAFLFLSGRLTCPVALEGVFSHARNFPVNVVHQGLLPVDRVWNMVRASSEMNNRFVLNQISRRQLAFYFLDKDERMYINLICEASIALSLDLSIHFARSSFPKNIPHVCSDLAAHLNRTLARPKNDDNIEYLDSLLASPSFPVGAIYNEIASLLTESHNGQRRIQTCRVLLRLAQLKLRLLGQENPILLLEDIEDTIVANCQQFDLGLFHQCRAHCLLKTGVALMDSLKCVQEAISAFDYAHATKQLVQCVVLAAMVSQKLGLVVFTNFYSEKYVQITDAIGCDLFFTEGQPALPKTLCEQTSFPLSPLGQGRGVQTLIAWSRSN